MELPARKNKILNAVVKQYISAGEPVGSKALLGLLDFPVSSATVRNEMAALSEMGYLVQPHTSAGRIPTQLGYRYYLDHSIEPVQIDPRERRAIDDAISLCADDPEDILSKGAEILSQLTGYAALSTTPPADNTTIERIKVVQVSRHTSMMVMITSKGMVKNRLFRCDYNLDSDTLKVFEFTLNDMLSGVRLDRITPAFVQTVAVTSGDVMILMPKALLSVMEAAREASVINIVSFGLSNLLQTGEFNVEQLKGIYRFLHDKTSQEKLLFAKKGRIATYIGTESKNPDISSTGIAVAHYPILGVEAGAFAVIGPVRMDYTAAVAYADYISQTCGRLITELLE